MEGFPKPVKIACVKNLQNVWEQSRDAKLPGGAPGIDGVSAERFHRDLHRNLAALRNELCEGRFRFQRLRPVLIPKDGGRFRVICIPTVRDRLVQRLISKYLSLGDKLGVANSVSFGFRRDFGVIRAVKRVNRLRAEYPWVLKSDIASFFDQIDREMLKRQLLRKLGRCSIYPILCSAIDCEVDLSDPRKAKRVIGAGISEGRGLRQGMPLSPILSNFVLRDFDKWFENKSDIRLVRYADDFVILSKSKRRCEELLPMVKYLLQRKNHTLQDSKTFICGPDAPVDFLGFEIALSKSGKRYTALVPKRAFDAIERDLRDEFGDFQIVARKHGSFSQAVSKINATVNGFVNVYRYANNHHALVSHAQNCRRHILQKLLLSVFGHEAMVHLDPVRLRFLELPEDIGADLSY